MIPKNKKDTSLITPEGIVVDEESELFLDKPKRQVGRQ